MDEVKPNDLLVSTEEEVEVDAETAVRSIAILALPTKAAPFSR